MENRIENLKEKIIGKKPCICPERARYFTKSWKKTEHEPINIRRALAFKSALENQTVFISADELIVGNQAGRPLAAPFFPEYGIDWIETEIDNLPERRLDPFDVDEDVKKELKQIAGYWKGKTHFDLCKSLSMRAIPQEFQHVWDPENGNFNDVVSNSGRMASGNGHVIVNYEKAMRIGLRGIINEAEEEIEKNSRNMADPEAMKKRIFLESVIISMQGAIRFANRHADEAERLSNEENDADRKAELIQIARICRKVPEFAAESFWEAIQAYWMMHVLLQIEMNGHSISFGRFDQYLYPYYRKDVAAGIITREKTQELIECLMIKCNEIKKVRQWSHTRKMHGYPLFQTLTIGGIKRDGSDGTNELTYITLDATANVKLQEPTTVARIHPKSPQEYVQRCSETIIKHGGGLPGMFNDEVTIPMLMSTGVTLEDARDWAIDGCCEPIVPGKHNTITSGTCHINLLKVLDMTIKDGVNNLNGAQLLPGGGGLANYDTYDDFEKAYRKQLEFYTSFMPILDTITSSAQMQLTPCPFTSGLLDYRIQIGKDVEDGGGPNYNNTLMICHGSISVGNALYAMKKTMYEAQEFTPAALKEALDQNFEGEDGQRIRRVLLDCPKYGNDNDDVDYLVRDSLNWWLKEMVTYTPMRGGCYCPSPQTLSANAYTGAAIDATPDGRLKGEPTADNSSPGAGDDLNGATAVMKSVAKLDHALATHGTILNMKFHPTAVSGSDRVAKFSDMIRAYFSLQGFQVQFNIVSAETLRKAQNSPEQYKNLVIKVAGYSALFTTLEEHLQNQIIARTEHAA